VWPVRRNPGTNRAYQLGIDREDGTLARFTSVCAPIIYRGDRLPADMKGDLLFTEPVGRLIRRAKVENIEGLTQLRNLQLLPPTGALLVTAPLPIVGGSGSPTRVLALVER